MYSLSKLMKISASTMGTKSIIFLLQFVSLFSFIVSMPNEPLRSYVDCSKYGSPHVSISVLLSCLMTELETFIYTRTSAPTFSSALLCSVIEH